jgi:hypothetical protein
MPRAVLRDEAQPGRLRIANSERAPSPEERFARAEALAAKRPG